MTAIARPGQSMAEPALDSRHGPARAAHRCTGRAAGRPRGGRPRVPLPPRAAEREAPAQARERTRATPVRAHARSALRTRDLLAGDHVARSPEGLRSLITRRRLSAPPRG